jgi:hypothetical protein
LSPTAPSEQNNLNPNTEDTKLFESEDPSKVLITDLIINWLAPEIANGTYTIDEIKTELEATFTDEEAKNEFIGQLTQKADSYETDANESAIKEEQKATQGAMNQAAPAGNNTFEPSSAQGNVIPPTGNMLTAQASIEEELARKDAQIQNLAEERSIRFQVKRALDFIKDELQTRGFNGEPLLPTVDYLVKTNGIAVSEAEEITKNAIKDKVKELVELNDTAWNLYCDSVYKIPKLSAVEEASEDSSIAKESHVRVPFLHNESRTGIESILPDEMFTSRISEIADKHAMSRTRRRI